MDAKKNIIDFENNKTRALENFQLEGIQVENEDLSGYIIENTSLYSSEFIQCDFSNARIGLEHKVVFKNSLFKKVDFRSVGIVNVAFENCEFINCDFRGTSLCNQHTYFFSCLFKNCKIVDQQFLVRNFQFNTIEGKLSEVKFIGKINSKNLDWYQLKINLSKCKFSFVEFLDCDIANIIPPQYSNYLYIDNLKNRVNLAMENIRYDDLSQSDMKTIIRRLNSLSHLNSYIFNIYDEIEIYGIKLTRYFFNLIDFPIDESLWVNMSNRPT